MTEQQEGQPKHVWTWLKRPEIGATIGIIGVVLAVAGLGFGYYLFRAAQKVPELSFQKSVVQVFNAESSSRAIGLVDLVGQPIQSNVYAAKLVVWNSGSAPIKKEDIRKPIQIIGTGDAAILDFEFLGETEIGISKFNIEGTSSEVRHRVLPEAIHELRSSDAGHWQNVWLSRLRHLTALNVGWEHFDPGHGFRVRVIYSADDADKLMVVGNVYGSGEPIDRTPPPKKSKLSKWNRLLGLALVAVSAGIVLIYINIRAFRFFRSRLKLNKFYSVSVAQLPVLIISAHFVYLFVRISTDELRTIATPPL